MSDMLYRLLQKCPTVLGAQASSPARVPSNQQSLTELVALDAGRRGRPRSQGPWGLFCKSLFRVGNSNRYRLNSLTVELHKIGQQ